MTETRIRTSLQHAPKQPMSKAELEAMCGPAWVQSGWVCCHIDSILDEWLKQGMANEMNKRHGKRKVK